MYSLKKIISLVIILFCGNVLAQIDHKKVLLNNVWSDNCNQKQGFILFVEDTKHIIKKYYDANGSENTSWVITKVESLELQPLAVQLIYKDKKKLGGEVLIFKSDLTGFRVHNRYLENEWIISNYKFEGTGLDTPEIKKCLPTSTVGILASKTNTLQENAQTEHTTALNKFCRGVPRTHQLVIERLSTELIVNPNSIKLQRVELRETGGIDHVSRRCFGIFYSSSGATTCEVQFDSAGTVVEACKLGYTSNYTGDLANSEAVKKWYMGPKVAPYDQNGNPTESKEWGEGDRYRIR